jgi:hypothetical protein
MPAVLNDIDQVLAWLDFVRIDVNEALGLLENHEKYFEIDPVSNYVFKKSNIGPKVSEYFFVVRDLVLV